jgi:hypothetical protein
VRIVVSIMLCIPNDTFPGHGSTGSIVPVKTLVRKAEGLELGDLVTVRLAVDV